MRGRRQKRKRNEREEFNNENGGKSLEKIIKKYEKNRLEEANKRG